MLLAMLIVSCMAVSCGDDDEDVDEPQGNGSGDIDEKYKEWYTILYDTNWKLYSSKTYYSDGTVKDNTIPKNDYNKSSYQKYLNTILSFKSVPDGSGYVLLFSTISGDGYWKINDKGELVLLSSYYVSGNPSGMSATDAGIFSSFFPTSGSIFRLTNDELILKHSWEYASDEYIFHRYYGSTPSNPSAEIEKPEIGLEDYTCSTNSITVKYRIYNQDKAKVTSATGYIGLSQPTKSVSGSVNGNLITIRFTSLSKNETYYIKCNAVGAGGNTTSEVTKLSTY